MATLETPIAAAADDGFSIWDSSWDYTAASVSIGSSGGTPSHGWLHFTNITIPAGSTISSAHIHLVSNGLVGSTTVRTKIYGVDEDTSPAPTDYATWLTDHGLHTTAWVAWDFAAQSASTAMQSSDITTIIQEIVDRGSWASGNTIGIHIDDNSSDASCYQNFASYENVTYDPAELHVEYTPGATAVGQEVQALWDVADAVGAESQAVWNVLTPIGQVVQCLWNVKDAVGAGIQAVWAVGGAVGAEVQALWDVAGLLGPGPTGDGGRCVVAPFSAGACFINPLKGGSANVAAVTGGKAKIHES